MVNFKKDTLLNIRIKHDKEQTPVASRQTVAASYLF